MLQSPSQTKRIRRIFLRLLSQWGTQMRCACNTHENIFPSEIIVLITPPPNPFTKLIISTGCRVRLAVPYSTKYWRLFVILAVVPSFLIQGAQAPVSIPHLSLLSALARPRRDRRDKNKHHGGKQNRALGIGRMQKQAKTCVPSLVVIMHHQETPGRRFLTPSS